MSHQLSRRQVLATAAVAAVAEVPVLTSATVAQTANSEFQSFMAVSQSLTGRKDLDPVIGNRLMEAMQKTDASTLQDLPALAEALISGNLAPPLEKLAVDIQSAWYTGTVGQTVVTYEKSLCFKAVEDYLAMRSYCGGEPGFWAANPNKS